MAKDTTSGSFDFTSLLRRSVSLRMTALGSMARAGCCCVLLAVPGLVRALQSPQETQSQTRYAQPIQSLPTPTPTPLSLPTPQPLLSPAVPPTIAVDAAHPPSPSDE